MKLVIATHNPGKFTEIKGVLKDLPIKLLSLDDLKITEDAVEDADTLAGNALKKAKFYGKKTFEWVLADDTGIFIPSLGNEPGVRASRWAEDNGRDDLLLFAQERIQSLEPEERKGYFETVAILRHPNGEYREFSGRLHGTFLPTVRGGNAKEGLPYDYLFMPDGYEETFAEMDQAHKEYISHRAQAMQQVKEFILNSVLKQHG